MPDTDEKALPQPPADIPWSQRLLHRLDPEFAHSAAIVALRLGVAPMPEPFEDPVLATSVWGLDFANPIGLAAGFDKHAQVIDQMLRVGFGFVEAGSVTPRPQPGNPKPRVFRLAEDGAVINRLGFNSQGLDVYLDRLRARCRRGGARGVVGANVGKNKQTADGAADYVLCVTAVAPLADYIVCNVSSPNTPGLRSMQARAPIAELLARVLQARNDAVPAGRRRPPLLAKVGPDLDEAQVEDIAQVALATGIDGLIIGNTTIERPASLASPHARESGGLSGAPLLGKANHCLAQFARATGGTLPIIGCGGVASGADAYAKIRAGASLVQLYSALVFHGPGLVNRIKRELAGLLRRDGFASVGDAVGADHR
jgi:dihydroorotate dehydrogenase